MSAVCYAQCYEKFNFGSFQKGGHRESRTLISLQVKRVCFTDIPTFSVPGLGEIRTIKFWVFFEILDVTKKFTQILLSTYRIVIINPNFFRNDDNKEDIKYFSNWCPNFKSPFLWNRSMKILKNFITYHSLLIGIRLDKGPRPNVHRKGFKILKRAKKSHFITLCYVGDN